LISLYQLLYEKRSRHYLFLAAIRQSISSLAVADGSAFTRIRVAALRVDR